MDPELADLRYEELRQRLTAHAGNPGLTRTLRSWAKTDDKHLPQRALDYRVDEILQAERWQQIRGTRGVGRGRVRKLIELFDRIASELEQPAGPTVLTAGSPAPPADPDAIPPDQWRRWAAAIRRHRLDRLPLGRFARSLAELPGGLWAVPLADLADPDSCPGIGPSKARQVRAVVADVGRAVDAAATGHLLCRLLVDELHGIAAWIDGVLACDAVPGPDAVRDSLILPLLALLAADLGDDTAALVRRRWGWTARRRRYSNSVKSSAARGSGFGSSPPALPTCWPCAGRRVGTCSTTCSSGCKRPPGRTPSSTWSAPFWTPGTATGWPGRPPGAR